MHCDKRGGRGLASQHRRQLWVAYVRTVWAVSVSRYAASHPSVALFCGPHLGNPWTSFIHNGQRSATKAEICNALAGWRRQPLTYQGAGLRRGSTSVPLGLHPQVSQYHRVWQIVSCWSSKLRQGIAALGLTRGFLLVGLLRSRRGPSRTATNTKVQITTSKRDGQPHSRADSRHRPSATYLLRCARPSRRRSKQVELSSSRARLPTDTLARRARLKAAALEDYGDVICPVAMEETLAVLRSSCVLFRITAIDSSDPHQLSALPA